MKIWQVDSFTKEPFKGNPAGVMILNHSLSDALMQKISCEMNLSESAFIFLRENKNPLIRFFTPTTEVDLCGHATLAGAHIYFTEMFANENQVTFETKSVGNLPIRKSNEGYTMDFPSRLGEKMDINAIPDYVLNAISTTRPVEAYLARDLMLVYNNEATIRQAKPNFAALENYEKWIIITSQSKEYDFISRFICAGDGLLEDPVTGSAHCTLGPYWAKRLNKNKLHAYQASERGGELHIELDQNRVFITGQAVTVIEGTLKNIGSPCTM